VEEDKKEEDDKRRYGGSARFEQRVTVSLSLCQLVARKKSSQARFRLQTGLLLFSSRRLVFDFSVFTSRTAPHRTGQEGTTDNGPATDFYCLTLLIRFYYHVDCRYSQEIRPPSIQVQSHLESLQAIHCRCLPLSTSRLWSHHPGTGLDHHHDYSSSKECAHARRA